MILEEHLDLQVYVKKNLVKNELSIEKLEEGIRSFMKLSYADETGISKYSFDDKISTAIVKLTNKYIAGQISRTFPLLSSSLFDKRRHLLIANDGDEVSIKEDFLEELVSQPRKKNKINYGYTNIPLLVSCSLNEDTYSFSAPIPGNSRSHAWFKTMLPAKMPSEYVTQKVKAFQIIHSAITNLWDNDLIARQLVERNIGKLYQSDLKIYWIPELKNISVDRIEPIPKDPILVMRSLGYDFLIAKWEEPKESKLSAILSEFNL